MNRDLTNKMNRDLTTIATDKPRVVIFTWNGNKNK